MAAKPDERLGSLQDRVGQSLHANAEQAGQTMTELRERLAVIDAAQKNIAELSSQVVDLQNVLSNKQARAPSARCSCRISCNPRCRRRATCSRPSWAASAWTACCDGLPNPPGCIGIDAKFPLESRPRAARGQGR